MYLINKLYIKFADDDGHSYLIDKENVGAFDQSCENIWDSFREHGNHSLYYEEYNDLLEAFECVRVEGEELFTVFPEDVTKENKWKEVALQLISQVDKLAKGEIKSIVIPANIEDLED